MEAANPFALLADKDPNPSKTKSKNRKKKPQKNKRINNEEQMTIPHAALDMTSPIFLPPEAETSEVIQKQGINHAFGSVLLASFSFLFLLLLRLFNATVRSSPIPSPPQFSSTFAHESSFHLFKRAKPASFRKVVVTLDVSLLI